MKKNLVYVAIAALLGFGLAGCAPYVSPCTRLAPPSAQELAVAAQPATEVEKETEGKECDLVNGAWSEEEEKA